MKSNAQASGKYAAALKEWIGTLPENRREYFRENAAAAVKLPEGYYVIPKPDIYEKMDFKGIGPEAAEKIRRLLSDQGELARRFKARKLSDFVKSEYDFGNEKLYVSPGNAYGTARISGQAGTEYLRDEEGIAPRPLTDAEASDLAGMVAYVRDSFGRDIDSYLERYGMGRVKIDVSWSNRP